MSYQNISDAFDARIGGVTQIDLQYEGVAYTPVTGRPYLSARLLAYTRTNAGFGPDCVMSETGSYQISVNWPSGEGRPAAGAVADQIVAAFPRALALQAGAQVVSILYTSAAPSIQSGDWLTIPVVVSWMATDP